MPSLTIRMNPKIDGWYGTCDECDYVEPTTHSKIELVPIDCPQCSNVFSNSRKNKFSSWVSVEDILPSSNRRVLFCWTSVHGASLISVGFYAGKFEVEAVYGMYDDDVVDTDYDNSVDYLAEGWYEQLASDDTCYPVIRVTHWMLLPYTP